MLKGIYSRGNIYIYDVSFNNNITIKCGIYIYFRVKGSKCMYVQNYIKIRIQRGQDLEGGRDLEQKFGI